MVLKDSFLKKTEHIAEIQDNRDAYIYNVQSQKQSKVDDKSYIFLLGNSFAYTDKRTENIYFNLKDKYCYITHFRLKSTTMVQTHRHTLFVILESGYGCHLNCAMNTKTYNLINLSQPRHV